ncbi:MAG: hypothetical protein A2Z49_10385 [Chloroflexi bacterium RBG_19FT_COMBO_56_12]|nr:MAG: hypothetical protein A2Z49_10385 [Chloroflexi bacterium RBG_19FT_COMBO_56_12]
MLEEFREQASSSPLYEGEETFVEVKPRRPRRRFLGMTAAQRFMIAIMLLMMACLLGALLLLVTEKIVPPALF